MNTTASTSRSEVVCIELDLIARTPGTFTGPASSSYLYYTNELKAWAPATSITVNP